MVCIILDDSVSDMDHNGTDIVKSVGGELKKRVVRRSSGRRMR